MADFGLLNQTPNFLATAQTAFQAGQQQAMQRNRQQALAGYGADPSGTRNALLSLGDVQTANQLQGYEQGRQQTARADQQFEMQQQAAQQKQQNEVREWATKSAQGLRALPPEGRVQTYLSQVAPVLQQLGLPADQIQAAAQNGITDEELDGFMAALGGEVQQPRIMQAGRQILSVNPQGNAVTPIYTAPLDPLEQELQRARIAATQAQADQRGRSNRPKPSKGGGRGNAATMSAIEAELKRRGAL